MIDRRRLHLSLPAVVPTEAPPDSPATQRVATLMRLFVEIGETVERMRAALSTDTAIKSAELMRKLSEMQTLHVMLLKSEETFHDTFGHPDTEDGIDYDAIRRDLGRRLDRIRSNAGAVDVSE